MELLIRFLVGGAVVMVFAMIGDVVRPKSFAGIFGAAPSVALATLALTLHKQGASYAVTVVTGLLAKHFGPVFGGLFLAFPAIFPAGATLIAKRETQKKARQGLHGEVRGRRAAALDAAGAVLGAVGLICFAVLVWKELPQNPTPLLLCAAMLVWTMISLTLWWLRKAHPWR